MAHLNQANTYNGGDGLTVNAYGLDDLDMTVAFGDTYLFTSNVVNSLRAGCEQDQYREDAGQLR